FAGEDGNVFEAAEAAHGDLSEDGDAEPIELGQREGKGLEPGDGSMHQAPNGQGEQDGVGEHDEHAAGVVQPLADIEAVEGDENDAGHDAADEEQGGGSALGDPRPGAAKHVREVCGDDEDDAGGGGDGVDPEVPGDKKAG